MLILNDVSFLHFLLYMEATVYLLYHNSIINNSLTGVKLFLKILVLAPFLLYTSFFVTKSNLVGCCNGKTFDKMAGILCDLIATEKLTIEVDGTVENKLILA